MALTQGTRVTVTWLRGGKAAVGIIDMAYPAMGNAPPVTFGVRSLEEHYQKLKQMEKAVQPKLENDNGR